jgi:hypothetical protein
MKKYCYICIPIAGREHDVFDRAEQAKHEVIKLGYEPLCPLDLNKIGEKELVNHTEIQMTAWYMGRDIDMIIRDCDAIYCCEGWEYSKGCNVERECAKQYRRDILYQIPYDKRNDITLIEAIRQKRDEFCSNYCEFAKTERDGVNSDACKITMNLIDKFDYYMELFFNVVRTDNNIKFKK